MRILLKHGHLIIDGNREYLDGAILIDGERIAEVFPQSFKADNSEYDELIDLQGSVVMPGFFDTHTHGIAGMCFDDASPEEFEKIALEFAKDGTTSFLATLSYDLEPEQIISRLNELENVDTASTRFAGIHLEGPFLNNKHLGVGDPKRFLKPDLDLVGSFLENSSKIRQMTIAYELEGAKKIGAYLHEKGIRVMCGHSAALLSDLDDNVDGFTHLFNAMRGLHHRDMTLVNAAFLNCYNVELIADGRHISPDVLKLVLNNIDRDRIMLVTDSSIGRKLPDGEYTFISKKCIKKGMDFITGDGHYAGSVAGINDEMRVLYELGAKYTDLLLYSGLNAYRFYGLDSQFGTLEKGKYSDIAVMDDDFNIRFVIMRGTLLYV